MILIDSHKDVRFIDFSFYFKQHSQTQTGIREKHLERFAREREKSLICTQILKKIQQKKKTKRKEYRFFTKSKYKNNSSLPFSSQVAGKEAWLELVVVMEEVNKNKKTHTHYSKQKNFSDNYLISVVLYFSISLYYV